MVVKKDSTKFTFELKIAFGLGVESIRVTLSSIGISLHEGILYVPGPVVCSVPSLKKTTSSIVNRPSPCVNAPSTCPISMAGFKLSPTSISKSLRNT